MHLKDINIYLDLKSAVDIEDEIKKLETEKQKILNELNRAKKMLSNESFVAKAPESLVNSEKEKLEKYTNLLQKVEERLKDFLNNP